MSTWLTESFLQWMACIIVVLPFVSIAAWQERKKGRSIAFWPLAGLAAFFFIALALARSSSVFNLLPSPWQGMVLEGIFAFSAILATHTLRSSGLTFKISWEAWRDVILATLLLLIFVAIRNSVLLLTGLSNSNGNYGVEFLLFQLTLPGITEELVYRGLIQSRLNDEFSKPWTLFRTNFGWGLFVASILFWAIHAFQVNGLELSFRWQTLTLPLVVGFVLGWMRERSNSLVPSIIAHNLVNLLVTIL